MAGLVVLITALVAALASISDAATLHTREAVKPETILCARATGPFPNPQDCGSFLQCDAAGNIVTRPCPAGLEFNAKLGVCDYPENAGCSQPAPVEEPAEEHAEETTQEPAQPAEDDNNGGDGDEAEEPAPSTPEPPKCPAIENPEEAIQLPNPNDCNSFYKCDASGVAWLTACPAGLEYNARLRVCDYPANAGCYQPAPVEEPVEEPAEPAEDDNNEGDADEAEEPATPADDAPECPAVENPEEAIQLVNQKDCGSFYKCGADGVAVLIQCPAGLHYNAELKVCDYPASAGCSSD